MKKVSCLFLVLLFFVSGCASIVSKSAYPVTIDSQPNQALIVVTDDDGNQVYKGKTPTTITLAAGGPYFKGNSYTIKFSKPGYETRTKTIQYQLDNWYIGNLLFGGVIGFLIVDPLTGAMWRLPENITETLSEQVIVSESDKAIQVVSINQLNSELRKELIPIN